MLQLRICQSKNMLPVMPHQTNSHLGQVTPNLIKSLQYVIKNDYSEGGGGLEYLAPILGQSI